MPMRLSARYGTPHTRTAAAPPGCVRLKARSLAVMEKPLLHGCSGRMMAAAYDKHRCSPNAATRAAVRRARSQRAGCSFQLRERNTQIHTYPFTCIADSSLVDKTQTSRANNNGSKEQPRTWCAVDRDLAHRATTREYQTPIAPRAACRDYPRPPT